MHEIHSEKIGEGIHFHTLTDKRFKRTRITVAFLVPLSLDTASDNAIVMDLLKDGTSKTPSFTVLGKRLAKLYGAGLSNSVNKFGTCQLISIGVGSLADRYALSGEIISKDLAELLCEVLFSPLFESDGGFSKKYTALEKERLIDDIKSVIDDKRGYAMSQAAKLSARGADYGIPRLGTLETASRITSKSEREAYERILSTARIEIICIGGNAFDEVKAVMQDALSGIRRDYQPIDLMEPVRHAEEMAFQTETMPMAQAKMVIKMTAELPHTDSLVPAMRLMCAMLGGTATSKLFLRVREEMGLCYYCASRYDSLKSVLTIDCGVQQNNLDVAYDAIMEQVRAMQNGDFTEEEIEEARLTLINSCRGVSDSPGALESWYLGRLLSAQMRTPGEEIKRLEAVTAEQIIAAANLLKPDSVYRLECQPGYEGTEEEYDMEEPE